jgi:ABC-type Fe3+/spermidine/putrescine transport system ATPase subunit
MTHLRLSGLSKTYPGAAAPALDRITLEVASGSLVALLGPSGGGKTTALRIIAGLLAPDAGDVAFDGRSVLGDRPERRGAVMVFQSALLFPFQSVADNVGFGLRMRGVPKAEIAARVAEMLELVRLPGLGRRRPAELSGGQQQRVALARALIVRPKVLLLDEPLSGLDAHLRADMRDLLRSLQRTLGITTLVVTHDQEEAAVLADRVALLLGGRLRQVDAPESIYRRPADAEVAAFFGTRNLLPGVSADGLFDCALGRLALPPGAPAGAGVMTFRPESVRLGPAAVNGVAARVVERQFLGTQTRLTLAAGSARFEAALPPDLAEGITAGDALAVNLPPASLWVMPGGG